MNIHETTVTVQAPPAQLFRLLQDGDRLARHLPRRSTAGADAALWVRVDEPDTTLSWGSAAHHPGSLDVLPQDDPARSTLVLRLASDDDVAPLLPRTATALKSVAEDAACSAG